MNDLFRSFYSRLSLLFLLLVAALGTATLIIAFNAAGHLFDDVEQQLNRKYAASLAVELQPFVTEKIETDKIKETIHYMMVINPMVEIYLIGKSGDVLAYFTGPGDMVKRHKISMDPILRFLYGKENGPVRGDDPRTESEVKPFSAAPLKIAGEQGYVYVILRGRNFDRSLEMIRSSYYIRSGLMIFSLVFVLTVIAGLLLFSLLTRRLKKLGNAVEGFRSGNYNIRVETKGNDEIAALGETFNAMAESVEQNIKQRNDLLSNISHDLRSPLTAIRGQLETVLLREDRMSQEERRTYLEASLKNVSAFQALVEQLFQLSRLESGQYEPDFEMFNPAELAQDILFKFKSRADESNIRLKLIRGDRIPTIKGDIALLDRALTNLVENAVKFCRKEGQIIVSLEEDSSTLQIRVEDEGEGISPGDLPRIFERFYRADKSRDRRMAGTGLGLAIVREIAELHGGTVSAASIEGKGSIFTISLPIL